VGTAIVLFSLWPLNWIVDRMHIGQDRTIRVRLQLTGLAPLGEVTRALADRRVELAGMQTERVGKNRYEVELELRRPPGLRMDGLVELVTAIPDIELVESASLVE
ncbi:MAG: hypothetical protein M3P84_03960, partial [Chloroflexota bacterium]|nr:hypothetical protein [Chloroflexota bacterium]